MKKLGKIVLLLLTLCVIVSAFVLAASAETEKNTTDPFIVNGNYYTHYATAMKVVRSKGDTIYLNPDYIDPVSGEKGVLSVTPVYNGSKDDLNTVFYAWQNYGTIVMDLNGCTIRMTTTGALITLSGPNTSFTLKGEGKIEGVGTLVTVANDGSGNGGTNFNLIASGKGITIDLAKLESDTVNTHALINDKTSNLFNLSAKAASYNVSGKITINPYNINTKCIFSVSGAGTSFNASGATVIVNSPKSELQKNEINEVKPDAGYMFLIDNGVSATFRDSHFEYNHGNMFNAGGTGTHIQFQQNTDGSLKTDTYPDPSTKSAADPTTFIDADNSTFIAREGNYVNRADYSLAWNYYSAGYILYASKSALYATFDNCDFVGAHRAFTANSGYRSSELTEGDPKVGLGYGHSYVAPCHVIMTNCDYETSDDVLQTSPWLAGDVINLIWNGGKINLKRPTFSHDGDKVTAINIQSNSGMLGYTHAYAKLADNGNDYNDDWFGVKFSNVLFHLKPDNPSSSLGTANYTIGGDVKKNVEIYTNGDYFTRYTGYWVGDAEYAGEGIVPSYYGLSEVVKSKTTNLNSAINGAAKGNYPFSFADRAGDFFMVNDKANGYAKFYFSKEEPATSEGSNYSYIDLQMFGYSGNPANAADKDAVLNLSVPSPKNVIDSKYVVYEFDVATKSGVYTQTKITPMNRGAVTTWVPASGDVDAHYKTVSSTSIGGGTYAEILKDGTFKSGGVTRKLPTDGTWSRVSIIWEIKYAETTTTINGVVFDAYELSDTKAHIFLNGEYISSMSPFYSTEVIKNLASSITIDCVRAWLYPVLNSESDICFDNPYLANYTSANADIASIIADKASLSGKAGFLNMPENTLTNLPEGAIVDDVYYADIDDAYGAIRAGSDIELFEDADKIISVDSPLYVVTNGHSVSGFVSSSYVAVVGDGCIYFNLADRTQKLEVSFKDETLGIDTSAVYTEGSTLVPPEAADPGKFPNAIGSKYFVGWTLKDGADATIVSPAYDTDRDLKHAAFSVYVDAAVVEWYDNEGNLLHTESYKPGDGVLSAVYTPAVDIPDVITAHAWFDLAYKGYSAIELPTSGTYEVYPDMEPTAKSAIPANIKLNLTLFTNYELNIFVPLTNLPEEIAKDSIRVVRLSGADNEQAVGSLGECTVYSDPYIKFGGDKYGVADTSINTYRIYYKADGVELYKELSYGVPYYASAVMQQSSNNEARTLVMNMVNYASKVIAGLSVDKTGDRGAEIYNALLEKEEFAALVRTYDDDLFLKDGDIWKTDIKDLTYDDVIADDPETDANEAQKAASYWIESAGFFFSTDQPLFYIKFSENAEKTVNGIKKPTSSGNYAYWSTGFFGYIGVSGEATRPGKLYARYDADGTNAYTAWNDSTKQISYYLAAISDGSNKYSLYNMAETLNITLSNNNGDSKNQAFYDGNGVTAKYSLAAYIGEMITMANNEALSADARAEYRAAADMAKALYAYAKVTREFVY